MRQRPAMGRDSRTTLWFAGTILTLLGLFGMHGLGSHAMTDCRPLDAGMFASLGPGGAVAQERLPVSPAHDAARQGAAPNADVMSALMSDAASAEVHALTRVPATVAAYSVAMAASHTPFGGHSGPELTCVAILAGLVLALLRWLTAGRGTQAPKLIEPAVRRPPRAGRDPDPPSLTVLSIQRC